MSIRPAIRSVLRGFRPLGLAIVGTGLLIGFLLGRVLRPLPPVAKKTCASAPSKPLSKRMHELPRKQVVKRNPEIAAFMERVTEARTVETIVSALPERPLEWSECREWTCVASPQELIALARAGESGLAEALYNSSRSEQEARESRLRGYVEVWHRDLALIAWAQTDPEAAWQFYSKQKAGRGETFVGWMTRHHWPLVRDQVCAKPALVFDGRRTHDWRITDAASDERTLRQLILDYPEGSARAMAGAAAAALLKFYDSAAADRLVSEFVPTETK